MQRRNCRDSVSIDAFGTDACGNATGSRPGYVYPAIQHCADPDTNPRDAIAAQEAAHAERERNADMAEGCLENARRSPVTKPPSPLATDHPLRPQPPSPTPRPHLPNRPATTDRPTIPTVAHDAASLEAVRDEAYNRMVRETANAWRTPIQ